jgi:DNA (cytosine-5)-methyltransferase 1
MMIKKNRKMKKILVGSDCSGVGAFNQALNRLKLNYEEAFACDFDYYARVTFIANYGTEDDLKLALSKEHKYHSDNVKRIVYENKTENTKEDIEMLNQANEFGKKFSFYYPFNMYERDIPQEPIDLYMSSIPCQAFSLAGKRLGKNDTKGRGILFFNSLEFIEKNKPRFFIFENVKGLLSDDGGNTFNEWLNYLGGKSVNGTGTMFPIDGCVPYHIYWKVLNAKDYGVPQNRERVFIIGIRDDQDNNFTFPPEEPLTKRLKDVLEAEVEEKYYLSEKTIIKLEKHKNPIIKNENPEKSACIHAGYFKMGGRDQQYVKDIIEEPKIENRRLLETLNKHKNIKDGTIIDSYNKTIHENISPTISTRVSASNQTHLMQSRIRKLTPIEAFRLMDFPDSLVENARKAGVSDSQLYKQAGNSIVVSVLEKLIKRLNF